MNELVTKLVGQLGIQPEQAKGGAGILLKLAQSKLGGDFAKVAQAIPDSQDLIQAAPAEGGVGKLAGALTGVLGGGKVEALAGLGSAAAGFKQLKLDPGMIGKFVPVILSFVKSKGGEAVMQLLAKSLQGAGSASSGQPS